MNSLVLYADWKHGDEQEYLNINLDTELNEKSKNVLFKYIDEYLNKTFDLTYVDSGEQFNLSKEEFDHMLTEREYTFGEINNTYLFPTGVRTKIIKDETISLKELLLQ